MTLINEYFMYGILIPHDRYEEWENGTGRKFPVGIYGDIFCLFDSRDGKFVIVGKKIRATNYESPILVPELTETEENDIKLSVKKHFGIEGDFHYYFVKNYE
jgi:hypothetical protein